MSDPLLKVARDLSDIVRLYTDLLAQALHKAAAQIDGHSLPGGEAMVNLAHVADRETNERRVELQEQAHIATCKRLDHTRCWTGSEDEGESEPVLQTLLFWSEQWRTEHGYPLEGRRPTVATEANVIRSLLDWAWGNLAEWDDFARDVRDARVRLENLLYAGARSERGVPCLYAECRGVRLVRKLEPARAEDGGKTWRLTDWHCPSCARRWTEDRYAAMVTAAHEQTKYEEIDGDIWCAVDYAARVVGRPVRTVRTWVNRGRVAEVCLIVGRRAKFVRLADVQECHETAKRPRGKVA